MNNENRFNWVYGSTGDAILFDSKTGKLLAHIEQSNIDGKIVYNTKLSGFAWTSTVGIFCSEEYAKTAIENFFRER